MLDLDKPVRFKGWKVDVFVQRCRSPEWALVEWLSEGGEWDCDLRRINSLADSLENIPETVTLDGWCNVYRDKTGMLFRTKGAADWAGASRIACVHIHREITVGEGL